MRFSLFSAFYPFRGGIAQFNACLYRALEKLHPVKAYTFTVQYPSLLFPGKTQFVTADDVADPIPAERIVHGFNPLTYKRAADIIRRENPDVLVVNYWMTFFGYCLAVLGKNQNASTRRVAILHNLIPHEPRFFDRFLTRMFVKQFDGFVVMSRVVEQQLLSINPGAATCFLPHPWYYQFGERVSKSDACQTLSIRADKKTILFFGLIRDYKGLDLLIDAFTGLDESYQLVIAGEVYSQAEKYRAQIAASTAKERIHFFDRYIQDTEVKSFFSAADLCVLPYRSATQSGVIATAYQFEVPVLVTDVGGLKEAVQEVNGGVVVAAPEAEVIRGGIQQFFQGDTKNQLQQNIKNAKAQHSWEHFAETLIRFSKTLARTR
jgi:glycosyltransferase involved in cell wall biosynthesis